MSLLDKAKKAMYDVTQTVGAQVNPPPSVTCFQEKGYLIPQEFVASGDALVHKCPTWEWGSGDPSLLNPYLPKNKQYLVTRKVSCHRRARTLASSIVERDMEDDWIEATDSAAADDGAPADIGSLSLEEGGGGGGGGGGEKEEEESDDDGNFNADDIPDMDEVDEGVVEDEDPAAMAPISAAAAGGGGGGGGRDNFVRTRTYDLYITYDNFHWTPRVWLFGYDEQDRPLPSKAMLEDMSAEHKDKTVTLERHPHIKGDIPYASIHPCHHAAVMKRLIDMISSRGGNVRPDQSLFLFLKFISSAIPTIEYDYTLDVDIGN